MDEQVNYDLVEAAEILGTDANSVYNLIMKKEIPTNDNGISKSDLEEYANTHSIDSNLSKQEVKNAATSRLSSNNSESKSSEKKKEPIKKEIPEPEIFKKRNRPLISASEDKKKIITDYLREKYKDDEKKFFEIYGGSMGRLILEYEIKDKYGDIKSLRHLSNIMRTAKSASEEIGINNRLFKPLWVEKMSNELQNVAINGLKYLAQKRKLPSLTDNLTDDVRSYLKFRKEVLRGVNQYNRQFTSHRAMASKRNKLYSNVMAIGSETLLYFANLFAPQLENQISEFVKSEVECDLNTLENIADSSDKIVNYRGKSLRGKSGSSTSYDSFDQYLFDLGKLLYSFDAEIRLGSEKHLHKLANKCALKDLSKKAMDSERASHIFESAIASYDVYKLFLVEDMDIFSWQKNSVLHIGRWVNSVISKENLLALNRGTTASEYMAERHQKNKDDDGYKPTPTESLEAELGINV